MYVRGSAGYGNNNFIANIDRTISDTATGLMWSKSDSGRGMNWEDALSWVQQNNRDNYLGYNDWRLPNAKELQSIVRAPDVTDSAAIDPVFNISSIINEGGKTDYPFFWTSTTHTSSTGGGAAAIYIAFGRALGYMSEPAGGGSMPPSGRMPPPGQFPPPGKFPPPGQLPPIQLQGSGPGSYQLLDVHGAGAQRSDPKAGNASDFPHGRGPQGDVIRIDNYVRCVRDIN
jgi:hypothetical protein